MYLTNTEDPQVGSFLIFVFPFLDLSWILDFKCFDLSLIKTCILLSIVI